VFRHHGLTRASVGKGARRMVLADIMRRLYSSLRVGAGVCRFPAATLIRTAHRAAAHVNATWNRKPLSSRSGMAAGDLHQQCRSPCRTVRAHRACGPLARPRPAPQRTGFRFLIVLLAALQADAYAARMRLRCLESTAIRRDLHHREPAAGLPRGRDAAAGGARVMPLCRLRMQRSAAGRKPYTGRPRRRFC
jgi:hypothetical protein